MLKAFDFKLRSCGIDCCLSANIIDIFLSNGWLRILMSIKIDVLIHTYMVNVDSIAVFPYSFAYIFWLVGYNMCWALFIYIFLIIQVKITEIYDVTDADAEGIQSPAERELNNQLEFDNDWGDDEINFYDNGKEQE